MAKDIYSPKPPYQQRERSIARSALSLFRGLLGFTAASLLLGVSVAKSQEEKVLNIYNWSDYIAEDTIENFEKEFGIDVNYDVYDDNSIVVSKVSAGNSGYDIIVPTAGHMQRLLLAGLLKPLNKSLIPNLTHADPFLHAQIDIFDPGNKHSFIYQWGTTGIGYNVNKIKELLGDDALVASWDLLLDPANAKKLASCGIVLLDSAEEVLQPMLIGHGLNPNDPSTEDMQKMIDKLTAIRPYIRDFHSSQPINDLATGEICMFLGWSGDILQSRDRAADNVEIDYFTPKEGSLMWADTVAIPRDAPHAKNAHLFFNYIMRPRVMADITEYVYYPNANVAATALLDEEILNDPLVYPTDEQLKTLRFATAFNQKTSRTANRMWTKLKTGH